MSGHGDSRMNGQLGHWTHGWTRGQPARGWQDTWAPGGRWAGTFVGAGHPLEGRDIVVVLPHREGEHAHLFGVRGYCCGRWGTALPCVGPGPGSPGLG